MRGPRVIYYRMFTPRAKDKRSELFRIRDYPHIYYIYSN
jgi:hypothetical protein